MFRNTLSRLSVKAKLIVILILPLIGLAYFSCASLLQCIQTRSEMKTMDQLSTLSVRSSALIHELQKERGMTSLFVSSKGTQYRDELGSQRSKCDERLHALNQYLEVFDSSGYSPEFAAKLKSAEAGLKTVEEHRRKANALEVSAPENIKFYSGVIQPWLEVVGQSSRLTTQNEMTRVLETYFNLLSLKEYTGIERATLSAVFTADQFDSETLQRYIAAHSAMAIYRLSFLASATEEERDQFNSKMQSPDALQAKSFEDLASQNLLTGKFGVKATDWFAAATHRIELQKQIEDQLSADVFAVTAKLDKEAFAKLLLSLALTLFLVPAAVFVTIATGRSIVLSLKDIATRAREIAAGSLDQEPLAIISKDEIGEVTQSINEMQVDLKKMVFAIGNIADQVSAASQELSANATGLSRQAKAQADETAVVATAMHEMSLTVKEVSTHSKEAACAAAGAVLGAHSTSTAVANGSASMREIVSSTNQLATRLAGLGESSKKIGKVVSVIEDIADQTNLLALNAAIEAARAGEHGRGFAIVADEVRKLAERTTVATREIEEMVSSIQSEANHAVDAMGLGSKNVNQGAEDIEAAGEVLHKVKDDTERVGDMLTHIASATAEQTSAVSEINSSIERISSLTREYSEASEQSAQACSDLSALVLGLEKLIDKFHVKHDARTTARLSTSHIPQGRLTALRSANHF